MPVKVLERGGLFRVVETADDRVARNAAGNPVDGGGHRSRAAAVRQVNAINLAELRAEGRDVPPPLGRRR